MPGRFSEERPVRIAGICASSVSSDGRRCHSSGWKRTYSAVYVQKGSGGGGVFIECDGREMVRAEVLA